MSIFIATPLLFIYNYYLQKCLKPATKIGVVCPQLLEGIASELKYLGKRAALYLAAAVSDFYVPWSKLVGVVLTGYSSTVQTRIKRVSIYI